jgi:putative flavoprotein involved in K+ transport
MHGQGNSHVTNAQEIFEAWLHDFASAVQRAAADDLQALLHADATWRDFMAFPWNFHHTVGRDETAERLLDHAATWDAAGFAPSALQPADLLDGNVLGFFDFTTTDRHDRGFVLLTESEGRFVATTMQTQVHGLQEHPERVGEHRPEGKVYGLVPDRTRWSDDRRREAAFADEDPAVLVLGAGHNGLSVAARLGALGVSTLVIDREARVGDTWRKRYASLALHSTVWGDNLPYLSYPPTWTSHTPKDKFADWLETYVTSLDLNVWTSTTYLGGRYDEDEQAWTIRVRRGDGSIRELRPRHFVVAGGLFADPKIPAVPGLHTFPGLWAHSDSFQDGARYGGRRALVVGAGVSGHELAHDLWEHGADVTLLQRSATYVISYDAYHEFWNKLFVEHMRYPAEIADQIQYAVPPERSDPINKDLVQQAAAYDRELLDRLQARGFKLEWGPGGTGIIGAHMSGRDSYQIDIGASQLIASGDVGLKQGVEIAEIRGSTVVFTDGTELPDVDLILFATGYHQFWGHIKPTLGEAAAKVDQAYGRAADGEYADTWRRSAQPGLWFATGFIRMARFYSQFTALLIKAIEQGIEPVDPDRASEPALSAGAR